MVENLAEKLELIAFETFQLRCDLLLLKRDFQFKPNYSNLKWDKNSCHFDSFLNVLSSHENIKWTIDNLLRPYNKNNDIREQLLSIIEAIYSTKKTTVYSTQLWNSIYLIDKKNSIPQCGVFGKPADSILAMFDLISNTKISVVTKSGTMKSLELPPILTTDRPQNGIPCDDLNNIASFSGVIISDLGDTKMLIFSTSDKTNIEQIKPIADNVEITLDVYVNLMLTGLVIGDSTARHFTSIVLEISDTGISKWVHVDNFTSSFLKESFFNWEDLSEWIKGKGFYIALSFYKIILV